MKSKPVGLSRRTSQRQQGIAADPPPLVTKRKAATATQKQVANEVPEDEGVQETHNNQVTENLHQSEQDKTLDNEEEGAQVDITQPVNADSTPSKDAGTEEPTEPNAKKRKTRGPTKMRGVAKHIDEKVDVEFTSLGVPVGKGSVTLSSFLGPLVREYVPVLLNDWRSLDEPTKERMWDEIQARFNIHEEWKKDAIFKQMGTLWRASKSRLLAQVKKTSRAELPILKPSNIQSQTAWKNWVKNKTTEEAEDHSDKFRKLRKSQIPHTTSRKGMTRLGHEMRKNSSDPSKVTRSQIWIAGHTHADGTPVRPEYADTIEKIKSLDTETGSTCSSSIRDDAVSQVLGRDKPGRVRGMGRGVTATKLAFMQCRDEHVRMLEAKQSELINKIEDLQLQVRGLAQGKQGEDASMSEASNAAKLVTKCKLLDWCSMDDVVVGEGDFCSPDAMYKIGGIPIGPSAGAVTITSVCREDAFVWRPTAEITRLGQALGMKIPWPSEKIMLDSELNSPTANHTSGSSVVRDKVIIYDWNKEDVIVAEGTLMSTDPDEMWNNIPLGPNAAVVKVDKVVIEDIHMWRPISEKKYLMGSAIGELIAWPISKIGLNNHQSQASPKATSPGSVSCSLNNSRLSAQSKCKLLDVNNSGEIVAEGKVLSNNPEDKVHHVPLGPNASKILVEVVKVGDAEVWRPNSEIMFVADAMGSFIAWPNDKLELM